MMEMASLSPHRPETAAEPLKQALILQQLQYISFTMRYTITLLPYLFAATFSRDYKYRGSHVVQAAILSRKKQCH